MQIRGYPIRTGNASVRDWTCIALDITMHKANVAHDSLLGGGPLDACDYLPAGACTSLTDTDWRGRPLPAQAQTTR